MVVIAQVSFPKDYLKQTVEILMDLEPLPEAMEMTGPYFRTCGEKVYAITFYNTDNFKEEDGPIEVIKGRYLKFGNVPNFVFEVYEWRTVDDSLSTWIG